MENRFLSSSMRPVWQWGPPIFIFKGKRGAFPRGRKANRPHPSIVEINNEWSNTSTPHTPLCYTQGKFTSLSWYKYYLSVLFIEAGQLLKSYSVGST
jgi:hypothetical protein